MVRFVFVASPRASRVSVAGDFNGWDPTRAPLHVVGGSASVWVADVAVGAGRHLYTFIVNGRDWVADPTAPLAPEDSYGIPNSVLVVGATGAM